MLCCTNSTNKTTDVLTLICIFEIKMTKQIHIKNQLVLQFVINVIVNFYAQKLLKFVLLIHFSKNY